MARLIFHVDVNSAFLSWEAARRVSNGEPDIRLIPSVIGGDREKRTGVVLAKSIPAKKLGIRTGEPIGMALRKCPDLFMAKPDFRLYEENSQKFMDGNKRAFDTLVKKYQSPVRRFFLHQTLGDEELSDDLAQETFIKAYTHLASFKNLSNFSTWLFRIAYNIFYDYIRNRKETSGLEDWEVDATYQTEQRRIGEEMDIYRGLSILKEAERTCITLRYMEDLSIDKIASITGMPSGTVKSHLSRGKEKLANFLKQNGYE